ncbi:MAG: MotA/TolQ/ExbB proton channel family protein [Lachnospiraceae bacterium]|nr:MotA/TolQ/ExbB proton channel family protein [Lachnospiraceae bacterium]
MEEMFKVIFSNLWGYDMLIFITAGINLFVFLYAKSRSARLYDTLHPTAKTVTKLSEAKVVDMRKSSNSAYSMYINITSIFPLLGILGTVLSLLKMAEDMSNVQLNFFGALTSTFWGLIFAILYKLVDGRLASVIDDNEKTVAFYLERTTIKRASLEVEAEKEK